MTITTQKNYLSPIGTFDWLSPGYNSQTEFFHNQDNSTNIQASDPKSTEIEDLLIESESSSLTSENSYRIQYLLDDARIDLSSQNLNRQRKNIRLEEVYSSFYEQLLHDSITRKIEIIFKLSKEEHFEDGALTNFSRTLISLVNQYGDMALGALENLIAHNKLDEELIGEALRWIGQIESDDTYVRRLDLLGNCLIYSESISIKDGAILGLSFMNDELAIPYLERALATEQLEFVRNDIQQVIRQLKG